MQLTSVLIGNIFVLSFIIYKKYFTLLVWTFIYELILVAIVVLIINLVVFVEDRWIAKVL